MKNPKLVHEFERERIRRSRSDYLENLRIYEALFEEAKSLGVFPLRDPLEGIAIDIKLARALNGV